MTQPGPTAPTPAPVPLQWQTGHGRAPDGTAVCQLTLAQGQLQAAVVMTPADMRNLAGQLLACARQAGTGLIVPPGALHGLNGH